MDEFRVVQSIYEFYVNLAKLPHVFQHSIMPVARVVKDIKRKGPLGHSRDDRFINAQGSLI
jgi:hypothetical protein